MISLHCNGSVFLAQCVPLAGQEADPMAECGAREPGLAVPHDLVSGFRIVLAVPVAAEMGNQDPDVAWLLSLEPRFYVQTVRWTLIDEATSSRLLLVFVLRLGKEVSLRVDSGRGVRQSDWWMCNE